MAPPMTGESGSSPHWGAERLRDRRLPSGRVSNSCDGAIGLIRTGETVQYTRMILVPG
jgi:hypothetical protein